MYDYLGNSRRKEQKAPFGAEMNSSPPSVARTNFAKKQTKYEFAGVGALVQAIGVIALWFFPLGTLAGVAMLFIGSAMSKKTLCDECGNWACLDKVDTNSGGFDVV